MPDSTNWHDHKVEQPKNDAEYLERMSHVIFVTGLNWRVLKNKWPGIKQAFKNFDIQKVASFDELEIEELMMNPDVIHNLAKIRAIIANAREVQKITQEFGSFENFLSDLRKAGEDVLRENIEKRFAFLGKATTAIFLFSVGEHLPKAHKEWSERHKKNRP